MAPEWERTCAHRVSHIGLSIQNAPKLLQSSKKKAIQFKRATGSNTRFSKGDRQTKNQPRCSKPLVVWAMHIRGVSHPARWRLSKRRTTASAAEAGEELEPSSIPGGGTNGAAPVEHRLAVPQEAKRRVTVCSGNSTPKCLPKRIENMWPPKILRMNIDKNITHTARKKK